MKRLASVLVVLLSATDPSAGADLLPFDASVVLLESIERNGCEPLPMDDVRLTVYPDDHAAVWYDAFKGNPSLDNLHSLLDAGVLKLEFKKYAPMSGVIPASLFAVKLAVEPDGAFLRETDSGGYCIADVDFSNVTGVVNREVGLQGGATKWNGVIAYITLSPYRCTPIPKSIAILPRCIDDASERQFRVLFREDSFTPGKWTLVAKDLYLDGRYFTESVPVASQLD